MVFSDLFFLFAFIPLFALIYLLSSFFDKRRKIPSFTLRNATLILFSLLFYAWGEPIYVFLMLFSVLINYLIGLKLNHPTPATKRRYLILGIAANLLILGIFKYLGFFSEILLNTGLTLTIPVIALPIGISFYTFQSISYLIDVYRGNVPPQKRYADLLLYISMFPQLVAGPIVRYDAIYTKLHNRSTSPTDLTEGIYRFLRGLAKKVLLANQLSEIVALYLDSDLTTLPTGGAWLGLLAFALQIYFDFSGYSDMAIGIGRCLGFSFPENFNHPYCCKSITDFWRRWHMTLGSFFRDYLYIPLGGNRKYQIRNILIVWFLTGMWHGASWNFILWGLYFGILLLIEKYTILKRPTPLHPIIAHSYSFIFVLLGWSLFYFDDLNRLLTFLSILFGSSNELWTLQCTSTITSYFWLWIIAILFIMPLRTTISAKIERLFGKDRPITLQISLAIKLILSLLILILSTAMLVGATNNAFLYTRF